MDIESSNNPVMGYPAASTAGKGGRVSDYPLPQPTTTKTSRSSPIIQQNINHDNSRNGGDFWFDILAVLSFVPILALLGASIVMFYASFTVPTLPGFSIATVSSTVRNLSDNDHSLTADLDVSFRATNRAYEALAFDYLRLSNTSIHYQALKKIPDDEKPPFVLGSNVTKTVWFRINNSSFPADAWDVAGDDEIIINSNSKGGKSRIWHVEFGLIGNVTYRGKTWTRRRIPIQVRCEGVKVSLSLESTETERDQTVILQLDDNIDESQRICKTEGLWTQVGSLYESLGSLLFFLIFVYLLSICICCQCIDP